MQLKEQAAYEQHPQWLKVEWGMAVHDVSADTPRHKKKRGDRGSRTFSRFNWAPHHNPPPAVLTRQGFLRSFG